MTKGFFARVGVVGLLLALSGCLGPTGPEEDKPKDDDDTPKGEQMAHAVPLTAPAAI
ncbi:MAG TPA: hypothetical protein VMM12_06910 [Longimicrobiales bacterium]|nr:hypothetical protein [Longimicrobiales bacterium]